VWASLGESGQYENVDPQGALGTVNDVATTARMLAVPYINAYDVWVAKNNDYRWVVHPQKTLVSMQGVPLVINAEFRLAAFSDIIYHFPIEVDDATAPIY
jgi:hypothetical protein